MWAWKFGITITISSKNNNKIPSNTNNERLIHKNIKLLISSNTENILEYIKENNLESILHLIIIERENLSIKLKNLITTEYPTINTWLLYDINDINCQLIIKNNKEK